MIKRTFITRISLLIMSLCFVLFVGIANAQLAPPSQISLVASPKHPSPGEEVRVQASFYLSDLDRAVFEWFINGSSKKTGVGEKTLTVVAPPLGTPLRIRVDALTEDGRFLSKNLVIRSADVDLLWEAETSAPPFYRGKTLPSSGSMLRVVAFPNFLTDQKTQIPARELFYDWSVGGKKMLAESGFGKNYIVAPTKPLATRTDVSVTVTSSDSTLEATKKIIIPSVEPEVVLYEEKPLLGVLYEKAVEGTFMLLGNEATLKAEGYHFAVRHDNTTYAWNLNGKKTAQGGPHFVLVKNDDGTSGTARIDMTVEHADDYLQKAFKQILIRF